MNTTMIDFSNHNQLVDLMDKYEEFPYMLSASNSDGEDQQISINSDNITVSTLQKNGWICVNVYWRDGTREETFDGKWK